MRNFRNKVPVEYELVALGIKPTKKRIKSATEITMKALYEYDYPLEKQRMGKALLAKANLEKIREVYEYHKPIKDEFKLCDDGVYRNTDAIRDYKEWIK